MKDVRLSKETTEWMMELGTKKEVIEQVESDMHEYHLHIELRNLEDATGIEPEYIYERILSHLLSCKRKSDEESYKKVLIAIQQTLDAVTSSAIVNK